MQETGHSPRTLIGWFWRGYVRRQVPLVLVAVLLMGAEGGSLGALSYMVRPMFDDVLVGGDRGAVFRVAFIVCGIFLARALAGFLQRLTMALAARRISARLQRQLVRHLLQLDSSFFRKHAPGFLIDRVRGDASGATSIVSTTFSSVGRDFISLLSLIGVALSIDVVWTLIALAGAPLLYLPIRMLQALVRKTSREARNAAARIATRLDEMFHGVDTIKLNTTGSYESQRFADEVKSLVQAQIKSTAAQAGIPAMMDIVAAIGFLGVLTYGGLQIIDGQKTIGEFMSFFAAIALVFEPLRRLGRVSGAWQSALVSLERLYAVFEQKPSITSPARPKPLPVSPDKADLALENVQFAYEGQPVLRDVSLVAKAGQTTALVGASGAGKSTVFHLLTRLADPQAGRVTIGGVDARELELPTLRGLFSVVTQDALMFDETIRANVVLGAEVSDDELAAVLEAAHVSEFLPQLALGADTPAGPRGSALSGGQRQRVAIARALMRDTPILLLDEATSALDAQSERIVQEALDKLSTGRTTLVIAHRLATVRHADKIVVMDAGRIVDEGTHEELMARGGVYADLCRLQFSE